MCSEECSEGPRSCYETSLSLSGLTCSEPASPRPQQLTQMQNESLGQQPLCACCPSPVQISRQCSLFDTHPLSSAAFPGKPKSLCRCSSGEKNNTWGPWPPLKLSSTCSQEKCQLLVWFNREQWVMPLLLGYPWSRILFSPIGPGGWGCAQSEVCSFISYPKQPQGPAHHPRAVS